MTLVKTLAVGTFLASSLVATGTFAKGHNQSAAKGATAHSFTVANAITEGTEQGNRPADKTPTPNAAATTDK